MDVQEQVAELISTLETERNIRRLLARVLRLLSESQQKRLALDYTEHMVAIYSHNPPYTDTFYEMLTTIRRFLEDQASIEEVDRIRRKVHDMFVIESLVEVVDDNTQDNHLKPYEDIEMMLGGLINSTVNACCRNDLAKIGAILPAAVPSLNVVDVADKASFVAARCASGTGLTATDEETRKAAREQGRLASTAETRWQILHILDILE